MGPGPCVSACTPLPPPQRKWPTQQQQVHKEDPVSAAKQGALQCLTTSALGVQHLHVEIMAVGKEGEEVVGR